MENTPKSEAPVKKKKKKSRKNGSRWLIVLIIVALMLGGAGVWFSMNYLLVGGKPVRRDAELVDVRGSHLTEEAYKELGEKLPQAEILWDVPLSGGSFDCESDSITIASFTESDLAMLGYFKNLTAVDAAAAELTEAQYHSLTSALPGAEVRWSVPLSGGRFACDSESIAVTALSESDFALLNYFDRLQTVDACGCTDYDAVLSLRNTRGDLAVHWQVPLSGKAYLEDAEDILVDDAAVTAAELTEALRYLPAVRNVDAPVNNWTQDEKDALVAEWPEIAFRWPVTICGTVYRGDETEMNLRGIALTAADVDDIVRFGPAVTALQHIDLTDTGVSVEDAVRIKTALPQAEMTVAFDFKGVHVTSEDTFLDFTGIAMTKAEIEAILPLLPKLERVEMTDCGIPDEEMGELNRDHESVRFVWTLYITRYVIRTDDVGFIGTLEHYGYFDAENIRKLIYCEDMICLDLGHRVRFDDLTFLYEMPWVQYLLLADTTATDITPVGSLKELIYFEMITSYQVKDLHPLLDCPKLLDVNVCFCTATQQDSNYEVFVALGDRLERLWYSGYMLTNAQTAELPSKMPNTDIRCIWDIAQATGQGWRYHKRYYEMRDLINMFYMGDYGGRQYSRTIDGVVTPVDPEFLANQRLFVDTRHQK